MENIGPKIGIDGEKEYKKQLQDITQQTKTLGAEMKALKSSFDGEAKTMEQNRQVKAKLNEQIEAQQKKIEVLNTQLDRATEKYGEDSTQALKLQENIAKATTALNAMESELKAMPSDLDMVGKKFEEVGGKVQNIGSNISNVGDGLTKGITVPIVAAGAASVAAFNEIDAAMDTLVLKTGATGEALAGMEENVKNIATNIPVDFQTAADAVGEVNTRFEVTGEELEDLSTKFTEFAAINNTDVSTSIDNVQSSMAAWQVQTKDTGVFLDTLTKVGQDTGVSVDNLASSLQTNAATLQEMNLSVSDSAIMLGNLEKNGVDTTAAMTGLKKAYAESIKSGTDMNTMLSDLEDRLQNGATQAEAEAEALSLFGTKAGPQLISALESGRMSFDALGTSMSDFAGTVESTYSDTLDPIDKMQTTMNELKVVGADLVTTAGPMLTDMLKGLGDVVHTLADAWASLDEDQQETVIKMAAVAAAIGPVTSGLGSITTGIGSVIDVGGKMLTKMPELGTNLAGIGAKISGLIPNIGGLVAGIGPLITAAAPFLIGGAVIAGLVAGGIAIYKNWDEIKAKCSELKEHISEKWGEVTAKTEELKNNMATKWNETKAKATETWSNVRSTVSSGADFIKTTASNRLNEIKNAFDQNGGGIRGIAAATWTALGTQWRTGFDVMNQITGGKLGEIKDAFVGKFKELKDSAFGWGKDIIGNLVDGISNKLNDVKEAADKIGGAIKDRLHFSEPDVGPLSDFHTWMPDMMKGLSDGMIQNLGQVENAATQVANAIAQPMGSNISNTHNYGGISIVINAADGQSASDIADEVEARIADKIARQEAVWA